MKGTDKETWDGYALEHILDIKKTNPRNYMEDIFFNVLEHDSVTARVLANEAEGHYEEVRKAVAKFKAAREALVAALIKATKNSDKY